ncbi:hypothetical protein PI124_g14626 [Phytophthora idaei]|nr:hypothetical protein PC117_g9552 [Phytophthora cactorum]KAG3166808.1 hypothetical protein C6341_g11924 [Phytophthora cactorum]KAG3240478.1 hypothetical protein PI124_g14626 [Phytophthora idaei]
MAYVCSVNSSHINIQLIPLELQIVLEEQVEQRAIIVIKKAAAEAQARSIVAASDVVAAQNSSSDEDKPDVATIAEKSTGESMPLKIARLQAQHDVIERAHQRATALELVAAGITILPKRSFK